MYKKGTAMRTTKRTRIQVTVLAAVALALGSLTACSSNSSDTTAPETTPAETSVAQAAAETSTADTSPAETVATETSPAETSTPAETSAPAKTIDLVEPTSPVTLNYVGAAYAADALKPVFAKFESLHPNIKVKYESVPFNDLNSILSVRLSSGGSDVDVFDADMPRTAAYATRGWLQDISPTFGDISSQVDQASIDASTIDGKLLAMPLQTSTQLLYFNKALLTAAGVDLPSADPAQRMTWEQVSANGAKAQAKGAKYGLVFDQVDRYYQEQPLPESLGGGPGATGPGNLTPAVNNDQWVKAFDWFGKQFSSGISPRGVPAAETANVFAAGQTAYFAGGPWWAGMFTDPKNKLDFGVAPYPYFEGGKAITPTGAWSLGLNPKSKNQQASLIFMKFMGLDDGGFTQYIDAIGIPPANLVAGAKYFAQPVFASAQMSDAKAIMTYEIANTATVRLKTAGYIEFEDIMTKTFSDIINGTSAKDALDKAQSDLDATWKKYR